MFKGISPPLSLLSISFSLSLSLSLSLFSFSLLSLSLSLSILSLSIYLSIYLSISTTMMSLCNRKKGACAPSLIEHQWKLVLYNSSGPKSYRLVMQSRLAVWKSHVSCNDRRSMPVTRSWNTKKIFHRGVQTKTSHQQTFESIEEVKEQEDKKHSR